MELAVGSTMYSIDYDRRMGERSVHVREFVIARETKTRWILGRKANEIVSELSIGLLKSDLSVYGGGGYCRERYYSSLPDDVKEIQEEMDFRSETRTLLDSFMSDNKRAIRADNEELMEVVAVLKKYRNSDGKFIMTNDAGHTRNI